MATKTPKKKKTRATRARKNHPGMQQAWSRTRALVETMLEVMEKGIRKPDEVPEQWERLFGAKSSAAANLEKLVQVLIELHSQIQAEEHPEAGEQDDAPPLTCDEVKLLSEWLQENPPA